MDLNRSTLLQEFVIRFEVWQEALPILDKIVSYQEMALVVAMEGKTLTLNSIAQLTGLTENELRPVMESAFRRNIFDKSLIKNAWYYSQTSFLDRLDHFVKFENWNDIPADIRRSLDHKCLEDYTAKQKAALEKQTLGADQHGNRLNDTLLLLPEVEDMLKHAQTIVIQPCNCRLFGQRCKKEIDICIFMDLEAEKLLQRGVGDQVSADKAIRLVREADKKGLMHTGDSNWKENGLKSICNCCACDCYLFLTSSALNSKGVWPKSQHLAVVDSKICDACAICVKRCPFNAFVKEDSTVIINGKQKHNIAYDEQKCWGCGLCANTCKAGAIKMERLNPT